MIYEAMKSKFIKTLTVFIIIQINNIDCNSFHEINKYNLKSDDVGNMPNITPVHINYSSDVINLQSFTVQQTTFDMTSDEYLQVLEQGCSYRQTDLLGCAKYKTFKSIFDFVSPNKSFIIAASSSRSQSQSGAGIHLVDLPGGYNGSPLFTYPYIESRDGDSELSKVFKFLLRQLDRFMRYHAITVPVEVGDVDTTISSPVPVLVEGHRTGKVRTARQNNNRLRRDLLLLLPLLVLAKLAGVKVLLLGVLLVQLAIKKMMVLTGMVLPYILASRCRQGNFLPGAGLASYMGYDHTADSSMQYPLTVPVPVPLVRPGYRTHRDQWRDDQLPEQDYQRPHPQYT